jgi:hypothetical protein
MSNYIITIFLALVGVSLPLIVLRHVWREIARQVNGYRVPDQVRCQQPRGHA